MLGKLFVNRTQLAVFVLYISIWVLHGQLVTWSKSAGMAPYSASLTVLFAELGKCLVCLVVYRRVHFSVNRIAIFIEKFQIEVS